MGFQGFKGTAEQMKDRLKWRRVKAPKPWSPNGTGDELVGFYGGRTLRNGTFGQYEVVVVHVPYEGSFTLSGVRIIQLLDSAMIEKGTPVRIVYQGFKELGGDRTMKLFELLVADGPPITDEELDNVLPKTKETRRASRDY